MQLDSMTSILFVAIALGCDAFSVGMAVGTRMPDRKARFRLWFHFGLFQFFMPIIGWSLGSQLLRYFSQISTWLAAGLLVLIALHMYWESFHPANEMGSKNDPSRGLKLIILSIATSIDALGVGLSVGLLGGRLLVPALAIGFVAGVMTWGGIHLGIFFSSKLGKRVETFGATVLLIIAVQMLMK